MSHRTNALLVLSMLSSAAVVVAGGVVLSHLRPKAALRVVDGSFPDCGGAGLEVLGGRDLDRDGVLSEREAEVSAVVCTTDGRLGLIYEPEPLLSPSDGQAWPRSRSRVLMDSWDEPPGAACVDGGLGLSVGVDQDRDSVLAEAEISAERVLCHLPAVAKHARSR